MTEPNNLTVTMLCDMRAEVRRVREERVDDRKLMLRIHDEMTKGFAALHGGLAEVKSDLVFPPSITGSSTSSRGFWR